MKYAPTHLLASVPLLGSREKRPAASSGWIQHPLVRLSIVVMFTMYIFSRSALGQLPTWLDRVSIEPPDPATTNDVVTVTLEGVWPNGCVPDVISHTLIGNTIHIDVDQPGINSVCLSVLTPWSLQETIGQLPVGTYSVTGTRYAYDPQNPTNRQLESGPSLLLGSYTIIPEPSGITLGVLTVFGLGAYRFPVWALTSDRRVRARRRHVPVTIGQCFAESRPAPS